MYFFIRLSLSCVTLITLAVTQSTKTISLNKTLTDQNKELYGDFLYVNSSSTLQVNFTDIGLNLSFIILQVHSHLYNVKLTKSSDNTTVIGTNIGFYSSVKALDTYNIENPNENEDLNLFMTVIGYKEYDPIPGGCNLESYDLVQKLKFSPISVTTRAVLYNKTYIEVKAATPKDQIDDPDCTQPELFTIQYYMLYLPEHNYDPDVYFDAIRKMTTKDNIEKYGYELPESAALYWTYRRMISAYPGTGAIYVAMAFKGENYSVYVPTHSYACSPLVSYDCVLLETSLTIFISVLLFFLGIFMCYFGHWFFKTQIVAVGFLSGFVVTYIIVSLLFTLDSSDAIKAAAFSGLCLGGLRLVCWWLSGIPAYIIVLSSADIGFLIASILYYMSPGGVYLQSNLTFWSLFVLVILLTTTILLWTSHIASMVCSAAIGGYTTIYPLDYYMGSNLKYIVNNTVRRAIVPEFNKAIINPPYQWRDIFLIVIWALLAISGFLYQFYYNKGRPPFPPPPRSVRSAPESPAIPTIRRRSSVAIFWSMWLQRCRQRNTRYARNSDETSPLLQDVQE